MGYLLIDNRESGGLKKEFDTLPCIHCRAVVAVYRPPVLKTRETYFCKRCFGPMCIYCGRTSHGECIIWRKQKEEALARADWNRVWSKMTGLETH